MTHTENPFPIDWENREAQLSDSEAGTYEVFDLLKDRVDSETLQALKSQGFDMASFSYRDWMDGYAVHATRHVYGLEIAGSPHHAPIVEIKIDPDGEKSAVLIAGNEYPLPTDEFPEETWDCLEQWQIAIDQEALSVHPANS